MPLSKYYGGHGDEVMAKMKKEYGGKKGERVFYATKNAMKNKANRTVMGRKVIHHSPDKHPEQGDQSSYDAMLEKFDAGRTSGTYGGMRKDMMPMQKESPKPAKTLDNALEYMNRMMGGGKKK